MSENKASTSSKNNIKKNISTRSFNNRYNWAAVLIKIIGLIILIISIWLGYFCFVTRDLMHKVFTSYNIPLFSRMLSLSASIFSGLLGIFIIGFGEIIQKLHEINLKM